MFYLLPVEIECSHFMPQTKRQWRVPRQSDSDAKERKVIQPGDSGIWITCNKGKERQCVGELRDLFSEYAEMLYGDATIKDTSVIPAAHTEPQQSTGIESEIQDEIAELQQPNAVQLFTPVRLDVQCGE